MTLFCAEMRHVDSSHGIAGQDPEDGAALHTGQVFLCLEHGERAEQPREVDCFYGFIFFHDVSIEGSHAHGEINVPLISKAPFKGRIAKLFRSKDRDLGLEKPETDRLNLTLAGIDGDCHAGLTRKSDSRTLQLYQRNTDIRNVRQVTLVSDAELDDIAMAMGIPAIDPEWLGANAVISGIPDLTLLPPSTRLQFPSGATLVVDMENAPCRQVADVIARHYPEPKKGFVASAQNKRGVTAWVECDGVIATGDEIVTWLPPNRLYAHA
jgi:hypothetical protein